MVFLHILMTRGGYLSSRIPTYLVLRYLSERGHKNLIVNGDKGLNYCKRVGIPGKNFFENVISVSQAVLRHKFDAIFVYDTMDAISSFFIHLIKRRMKFKVIYYNLEVRFFDYENILKREVGWFLEQLFILSADFFVGLSPIRLRLAEKVFKIPGKKFVIPNSFDFEAKKIKRRIYGKPKVLYAGGIEDELLQGIVSEVKGKNFDFVLHGVSKYGLDRISKEIKSSRGKNVKLVERFIPDYKEFREFVEKFDIGFVWYSTDTINDTFASWSSGKYFRYLSLGKPVIVRALPEIAETTKRNSFGIPIYSFSEIQDAVSEISSNYSFYVNGILRNYRKFEFSHNFERLYREIVKK